MKTDYYLNLCLEQAELSPLHHRHGCIVVKGGKVIGKGFNDYRPGYDGGALKTGLLPTKSSAVDKAKKEGGMEAKHAKHGQKKGFKPFENTVGLLAGGHHHANNSLSMHSEMMAINSALASSSTLAATTLSHFKPPTAPLCDSKRKRRQRRDVLDAFAERVCYGPAFGTQVQQGAGKAQNADHHHHQNHEKKKDNYKMNYKAPPPLQQHAHRQKVQQVQQHTYTKYNKDQYKYRKTYKPSKQAQPQTGKSAPNKSFPGGPNDNDTPLEKASRGTRTNDRTVGNKKANDSPNSNHFGIESNSQQHVRDRTKHPKLRGADVYVTRLGGVQSMWQPAKEASNKASPAEFRDTTQDSELPIYSTLSVTSDTSLANSLHDELRCQKLKAVSREASPAKTSDSLFDQNRILESHPCYRCILYMHSAGVRRVYWTNSKGQWETAKVRDMYDQLSGTGSCDGHKDGNNGFGDVFVTKHEILMLKRLSGLVD
ncbi:Uu.00g106150.m01.CDS01 [Anthostomella pinea]|uniref:Uu.00g106150.m01.CDS01 n=1 Tax=Anthostomella pinea TaxID=933095 RepID=A0AAI8YDG0_9PEZI|nr:Uu.00g106150.m01.CDS01 [Anthostomella pinea]